MTSGSNTQNSVTGTCNNPFCNAAHDITDAQEQVIQRGLALAFCGDAVFQVIECRNPGCQGKVVFRSDTVSPALDMREVLLVPNPIGPFNAKEQSQILRSWENWHDYLKFQFVPAWDEPKISTSEFMNGCNIDLYNSLFMLAEYFYNSLFMSEENFYTCLDKEKTTGTIKLRRLLPNTLKNNKLLICLAPDKIHEILKPGVASNADGTSLWDLTIRRETWKSILEEAEGKSFEDAIIEKLASIGIEPPEQSEIAIRIDEDLFKKASSSRDQLWDIVSEKGFDVNLDEFFKKTFRSIFYPVCTEFALENKRNELLNWTNEVEQGKALFVDAPMGIGKTYAIVEALAENPDLSAVVFMPTKILCQELTESLKAKINALNEKKMFASKNEEERIALFIDFYKGKKPVIGVDGEPLHDDDGLILYKYEKDFLKDQVYHAEGINSEECPHFDEIMNYYKKNWFKKGIVCEKCNEKRHCKFLKYHVGDSAYHDEAKYARIVVTTHHQYDNFYHNKERHKWHVNGVKKPRDMFIVDEDLVLSHLYKPYSLDMYHPFTLYNNKHLEAFIGTITDFIQRYDEISEMRKSIDLLYSRIKQCDKTSIIRSIDPEFKFPESFITEWETTFSNQPLIVPDYIEWSGLIGNHLKVIEHAIRFGAVVEKWGNRHIIHFPNPRSYNLSKVPPHVFFDGTMLEDKFLKNKLTGVEFKRIRIDVKTPWTINVYQNTNSDLPFGKIEEEKYNVQEFARYIINDLHKEADTNIFILTTKKIYDSYLKNFIEYEFPHRKIISGYLGNIRGLNNAKDCTVGIMLGSFTLSDSIEIAMALEFIDSESLKRDITRTENHLWTWKKTNKVRTYKQEFSIIEEMAKAYRHSEHRQALARTRYISHDVDFYIISKDPVSDYDPFLNNMIDKQFRADLFPPRKERKEKKDKLDEIKQKVEEWLDNDYNKTVIAQQIYEKYGLRSKTVGKKLKEMLAMGILTLKKGTKTTYMLSKKDKYGHDTLKDNN